MRKSVAVIFLSFALLTACTTSKEAAPDTVAEPTSPPAPTDTAVAAVETTAPATETADSSADNSSVEPTVATEPPAAELEFPAVVDPRAPGVTDTEIKVGITYVDFSNLRDVIGFDHGDYEAAYNAVIDDINAKGGIHGRTLVPVYAKVDPVGQDSDVAACTKLIQDEQVFVAMGFFLNDSVLCYVDTNETMVVGGSQTTERLGKAKAPWFTTDASEDAALQDVALMADTVMGDKVAIAGSVDDQETYESVLKPLLAERGITPISEAFIDTSSGDTNAADLAFATAAERFKADGVEQVLMASAVGGTFARGIAKTDFRPQLLFMDLTGATTYTSGEGSDLSVMPGAVSAGGASTDEFATLGSPTSECVALQEAAGLKVVALDDRPEGEISQQITASSTACRSIALLAAILEGAGPELNYGTFTTAGNNLGEIMLPFSPDPWHFGPGDATDGDQKRYLYAWDEEDEGFVQQ